jgi:hypothetical protein
MIVTVDITLHEILESSKQLSQLTLQNHTSYPGAIKGTINFGATTARPDINSARVDSKLNAKRPNIVNSSFRWGRDDINIAATMRFCVTTSLLALL